MSGYVAHSILSAIDPPYAMLQSLLDMIGIITYRSVDEIPQFSHVVPHPLTCEILPTAAEMSLSGKAIVDIDGKLVSNGAVKCNTEMSFLNVVGL